MNTHFLSFFLNKNKINSKNERALKTSIKMTTTGMLLK